VLTQLRGDLGEPDRGLDRLDLAEERSLLSEGVLAPVAQETLGGRGDAPIGVCAQPPPRRDEAPNLVDAAERVLLALVVGLPREEIAFAGAAPLLLRRRNWGDEL
jgi:hypothetical protein